MSTHIRAAARAVLLLGLVGLGGLGGCVSITSVPAGPLAMGDHRVTMSRQWSDISALTPQRNKKVRLLTIDGPQLNRLYLAQGLEPGEGLIKPLNKERPVPTWQADMAPTELVEFVANTVSALGYQRVETIRLRPAKFAQGDALRFDITAKTETGLDVLGTAQTAVSGGRLYVMLYLAPQEHYYPATLPDIEATLASAG